MECKVCGKNNLELILDLGMQPWCNGFISDKDMKEICSGKKEEKFYPLELYLCMDCHTSQTGVVIPKETMFSDHTYVSGTTKSLNRHFKNMAKQVVDKYNMNDTKKRVLDIGSNDGTQLKHYKNLGLEIQGIESSKTQVKMANNNGIPTMRAFFGSDDLGDIGKFDIINASGVFFHLENLHEATYEVMNLLSDDGIFVIQFLYMGSIMNNLAFDQIYHEHLLFYTLETLEVLLNQYGLETFDAFYSPIHGGTMVAIANKRGCRNISQNLRDLRMTEKETNMNTLERYEKFAIDVADKKQKNMKMLINFKENGNTVYGLGAPAKSSTLLHYFGIDKDILNFLTERNSLRDNMYSPGKHIPIIMENEIKVQPDIYYVLAWNFYEEILENNQDLIELGVKFVTPFDTGNND